MNIHQMLMDQQAFSFMVQQASHIEAEIVKVQYPDIQYPQLVPVDTSANEWAKSITYFSTDKVGRAEWFHGAATDMPLADVNRAKTETGVEMAAIGYRYNIEEIGVAMLVPGTNLTVEKADAARRAYEEFMENFVFRGDTGKGITGLINNASVTVIAAEDDGAGAVGADSPEWTDKTADQIIRDINNLLTTVYTTSLTVEMADTILLPIQSYTHIATRRIPDTTMTVLEWIAKYNVYTMQTGQPLTIRGVRGLDTAGVGGVGRMVAYRRDPRVLKLHLPMPHRFLQPWQNGPLIFDVPGIFRVGGVEIRRPGAVRYLDGIINPAYV